MFAPVTRLLSTRRENSKVFQKSWNLLQICQKSSVRASTVGFGPNVVVHQSAGRTRRRKIWTARFRSLETFDSDSPRNAADSRVHRPSAQSCTTSNIAPAGSIRMANASSSRCASVNRLAGARFCGSGNVSSAGITTANVERGRHRFQAVRLAWYQSVQSQPCQWSCPRSAYSQLPWRSLCSSSHVASCCTSSRRSDRDFHRRSTAEQADSRCCREYGCKSNRWINSGSGARLRQRRRNSLYRSAGSEAEPGFKPVAVIRTGCRTRKWGAGRSWGMPMP